MCEKFEKILMGILRWTCISPKLSGGLAILFVAKCYGNWDKFPQKYIAHKINKTYHNLSSFSKLYQLLVIF